jgi:hypothetical protein
MNAITYRIILKSPTITLPQVEEFLDKEVVVTVSLLEQEENAALPKKKHYQYMGAVSLDGVLDEVNIRDFANG